MTADSKTLRQTNQRFYDDLWSGVKLIDPARFNTWPLVNRLAASSPARLEVGPGMRPRLPVADTCFADISKPALDKLAASGGICHQAAIDCLPFADNSFDLICALDIIEHVEDDKAALAELCRVAKPGAIMLISTPLHPEDWTPFDDFVGHYRRYTPEALHQLLDDHSLQVEKSSGFGMKPKSSSMVNFGMRQLRDNPRTSLWLYNRVLMPLGLYFQKPLILNEGLVDTGNISDVFMLCRLNKS